MAQPLLAPTFLFRFSVPYLHCSDSWSQGGVQLADEYRLPCFAELEQRQLFADVRAAWNAAGLYFTVRVTGKSQPPWCRETRLDDSDGLHVWIDTRDTHNVHRASRFCHHFAFLPAGAGRIFDQAVADQLLINRARENANPIRPGSLFIRSESRVDGYLLECHIPAAALTGYDPEQHPRLGFCYVVMDRELGWQPFSLGSEFPFDEDPSLWGTLDLIASTET